MKVPTRFFGVKFCSENGAGVKNYKYEVCLHPGPVRCTFIYSSIKVRSDTAS